MIPPKRSGHVAARFTMSKLLPWSLAEDCQSFRERLARAVRHVGDPSLSGEHRTLFRVPCAVRNALHQTEDSLALAFMRIRTKPPDVYRKTYDSCVRG
jgi:hypothetical protein